MKALRGVDIDVFTQMLQEYSMTRNLLSWLEDEGWEIRSSSTADIEGGQLADNEDLARQYATNSKKERATLDAVLEECGK